jgi:NADH-quinone oxidoreductase subunit F
MEKYIIAYAAGDDPKAPLSRWLIENKAAEVAKGIQNAMSKAGVSKALFYVPEALKASAAKVSVSGMELCAGEDSLVMRDTTAILSVLRGQYLMPFFAKDADALSFGEPDKDGKFPNLAAGFVSVEEAAADGEGKAGQGRWYWVSGSVEKEGALFTPWGTSIGQMIMDAGGAKGETKFIVAGGLTGRWYKPDVMMTAATAKDAAPFDMSFPGSLRVYDSTACAADVLAKMADCARQTSCGKCPLCREGTFQVCGYASDIVSGKGKNDTIANIKFIEDGVAMGAFCQFGRNFASAVMSAVDACGSELTEHVSRKKCPAGVCKAFATYVILPDKCDGCGECIDECDDDAIEGKKGFIHMIDEDECTKCGKCVKVCPKGAIVTVTGVKPRLPKRLMRCGTFK